MNSSRSGQEKILVVEDEPEIRRLCLRILTSQGYRVDLAADGAAAKDMLLKEDYDRLIIDIRTPVVNGLQLYKHLEDKHPELVDRVVFMTGDVGSSEARHFLETTGRPFLLKPFTPDELMAVVGKP